MLLRPIAFYLKKSYLARQDHKKSWKWFSKLMAYLQIQ